MLPGMYHAASWMPRAEGRACSAHGRSRAERDSNGFSWPALSLSCRSSHVMFQYGMGTCEEKTAGKRSSINCESGACSAHIKRCCGDGRFKLGGVLVCCIDVGG